MGRIRLNRGLAAVWALNTALAAAAVALYLHAVTLTAPVSHVHIPWWALALAFAATEITIVHVHFRRNSHILTLGELPLVVGLLFCKPGGVMLAWVAGAALVTMFTPGRVPVRFVFNLAQLAVTAGIARAVFHAATPEGAELGPQAWIAATLAVLLAATASVMFVNAAMWLSGERIELGKLGLIVAMSICVATINASLGLALATVVESDPRAVVLLIVPVLAVFLAYRAYLSERRHAANLSFLHESIRTLSTASNNAAGLAGLLAMALENFRGEVAEVCLFPAEGEGAGKRISVGGPRGLEVMEPLEEHVVRELCEFMERDAAARLVTPEEIGGALGGHLQELGVKCAMLAPLPGVRRTIGTIMVADRAGAGIGGAFEASEIRLFDTLAHQTGSAVGQDSLTTKVEELRELQVELEHKAFHDPLTGLANRLLFMNRVDYVLKRRTGNAAVIYVDLDNFKPINDTFGHEAGDAVLKAAGVRLLASLRPSDTAARLGGDEFAVLLVDIPQEHISVVADRIVGNLTQPLEFEGRVLEVGASLGVASAVSGTLDADSLVRNADVAMYVAKHGGKGRLSVFEPVAA
jgi:diguanylate cyclase (GGDEF)-like protein